MKHPIREHEPSLEDARRALLEQIHSSRAVYRRMLADTEAPEASSSTASTAHIASSSQRTATRRERTSTLRQLGDTAQRTAQPALAWARAHPGMVAAGVVGVAALLVAGQRMRQQRARVRLKHVQRAALARGRTLVAEQQSSLPRVARGILVTGLATLGKNFLRNPSQLRWAARAAPMAMQAFQRWRGAAVAQASRARAAASTVVSRQSRAADMHRVGADPHQTRGREDVEYPPEAVREGPATGASFPP